jgi:hypothetical protein
MTQLLGKSLISNLWSTFLNCGRNFSENKMVHMPRTGVLNIHCGGYLRGIKVSIARPSGCIQRFKCVHRGYSKKATPQHPNDKFQLSKRYIFRNIFFSIIDLIFIFPASFQITRSKMHLLALTD